MSVDRELEPVHDVVELLVLEPMIGRTRQQVTHESRHERFLELRPPRDETTDTVIQVKRAPPRLDLRGHQRPLDQVLDVVSDPARSRPNHDLRLLDRKASPKDGELAQRLPQRLLQ